MKNKLSSKTLQILMAVLMMVILVVMGVVTLITRINNKSTAEWALMALDANAGEEYIYKVDEKDLMYNFGRSSSHYELYFLPGMYKCVLIHYNSDDSLSAEVYKYTKIKVMKSRIVRGDSFLYPTVCSEIG